MWEVTASLVLAAAALLVALVLVARFRRLASAARGADERLRDSQRFTAALMEHSSDLIAILNVDGTIRYASPSHERVLGYSPAELIGRNAFDLMHPDDRPKLRGA